MSNETCKPCYGCKLKYSNSYYKCVMSECKFFSDIIEECPCSICLIKGMCKTFCEPFSNYIQDNLYKSLDEIEIRGIEQEYEPLKKMQISRVDLLIFLQYYVGISDPYEIITVNNEKVMAYNMINERHYIERILKQRLIK